MRRYGDLAFRLAYVITGSAGDAEEAAQDAFVKAYFALDRFRPGAPFRPWLLKIVANEARNRRSAAARRFALALDAAEATAAPGTPEDDAVTADRARRLLSALDALRDEDRRILTYRYLLDLTEAEMADALGVARGTVKSRLSRALARARAALGPMGIDHD